MAGKGNQNAIKHGAAGALKRIISGALFLGVGLDAQRDVEARTGKGARSCAEYQRAQEGL